MVWHPRGNAFRTGPSSWELRNGAHAAPYATVEAVGGRFILRSTGGRQIGSYGSGDEAAEEAWTLHCAPRNTGEGAAEAFMRAHRGNYPTTKNAPPPSEG